MAEQFDVIIVGAGAAGVGCAIVLQDLGVSSMTILERYEVGASFLRWPAEMRFISPSFTSNASSTPPKRFLMSCASSSLTYLLIVLAYSILATQVTL